MIKNLKFKRQVGIEFNNATKSKETRNKILGQENILAVQRLLYLQYIQSKLKVQYSHTSSYTITCVTIRPVTNSSVSISTGSLCM